MATNEHQAQTIVPEVRLGARGDLAEGAAAQERLEEARRLAPYNNATSLQVSCSILGAMVWAVENPRCGVIDPDEMDFERNLEICMPYLGPVVGKYGDWTPLQDRGGLFPEDVDRNDPWQFKNFRVV